MTRMKNQSGFTLVELMVVCAVIALLFTTIMSLMQGGFRFFKQTNTKIGLESDARLVVSSITGDIRRNDRSGDIEIVSANVDASPQNVLRIHYADNKYGWYYIDSLGMVKFRKTNTAVFDETVLEVKSLTESAFDSLIVQMNDKTITVKISYTNSETTDTRSMTVDYLLRSGS